MSPTCCCRLPPAARPPGNVQVLRTDRLTVCGGGGISPFVKWRETRDNDGRIALLFAFNARVRTLYNNLDLLLDVMFSREAKLDSEGAEGNFLENSAAGWVYLYSVMQKAGNADDRPTIIALESHSTSSN